MNVPTKKTRLTEAELEILGILWERGAVTVRDVYDVVNQDRPVVYTGVLKMLQNMAEKGLVKRDEREKAHLYSAAVPREEAEANALTALSRKIFSGNVGKLAMRALEMDETSEEDLLAIRTLISRKLKEKK
jgi:predicted transcriptional regulator